MENIKIPRQICNNASTASIHIFCDASERGYGCCAYLVSATSLLICTKSRVSPLKTISIPRLELCAALLGAELGTKLLNILKLQIISVYCWTDSTITLAWIQKSPHLLNTFVANRVTKIQNCTTKENWFHVPSSENPADTISRGATPQELKENQLYWTGPEWLILSQHYWPCQYVEQTVTPEIKPGDLVMVKKRFYSGYTWTLGRVKEIHPGRDKHGRVATIQMPDGVMQRHITLLCPLPLQE